MTRENGEFVVCQITGKRIPLSEAIHAATIRPGVEKLIKETHPNFQHDGYVSKEALIGFREEYIEHVLEQEKGELTKLDHEVIRSMVEHETIAQNIEKQFEQKTTFGDRLADKVAKFGGSWEFIMLFGAVLFAWIGINTVFLLSHPFDPFPFILLNLVLSCIAAMQAPVIMMSQNRKDAKDRLRGEHDYKVNLKAELEIRQLHEKIDHFTQHMWQRLLEIQELQMDLMEDQQGGAGEPRTRRVARRRE